MPPVIRLATTSDGAALARIYRPAIEGHTSFELVAPDAADMSARIKGTLAVLPWLVYEADGIVAGYAYARQYREREAYRWTVEVSAYIDERFHRRGVARSLYRSLFAILASQRFATVVAAIALPNTASVALHTRMGFQPVGVFHRVGVKQGRAVDVAWFERRLSEDETPAEPIPLPALDPIVLEAGLAVGLNV